jgi:hypothetical protein
MENKQLCASTEFVCLFVSVVGRLGSQNITYVTWLYAMSRCGVVWIVIFFGRSLERISLLCSLNYIYIYIYIIIKNDFNKGVVGHVVWV